ncbi:hypothetical protein [Olivibacter sitiensis]|uniref:hypothetical protein n=1 Tax=Olivibacter sitiensis TaxID=376470 RepID=UPI000404367B|nr:hypothetical protein [Olivibacter sitiensis]
MKQLFAIAILFLCSVFGTHAQTAEQAEDLFWDFERARVEGDKNLIIGVGEQLLPMSDKLEAKWQTYFRYYLAYAYENNGQMDKAVPLYLKVVQDVPDYYVPHRALGYHYLTESNGIAAKIKANPPAAEKQKLMEEYQAMLLKALPYLEKSYACDPEDNKTLQTINQVVETISAKANPEQLKERLAEKSKNCVDLLRL